MNFDFMFVSVARLRVKEYRDCGWLIFGEHKVIRLKVMVGYTP